MMTIKLKRSRVNVALTTYNTDLTTDPELQVKSLQSLSLLASRMVISSTIMPFQRDGVRWVKTGKNQSIKNLFATYIQEFRGNEVVLVCNPEVYSTVGADELLKYVDTSRMEMTWACWLDVNGAARVFIVSANVVNYMLNDIPDGLLFTNDWQGWMHLWLQRNLRQRYFDASRFGVVSPVAQVESQKISNLASMAAAIKDVISPEKKDEPASLTQPVAKESLAKDKKSGSKGLKFW